MSEADQDALPAATMARLRAAVLAGMPQPVPAETARATREGRFDDCPLMRAAIAGFGVARDLQGGKA